MQQELSGLEIAIVGMSGRFPGARNISEFWNNLINGVESISNFSEDELKEAGVSPELIENPLYVKKGGIFEDADQFDASFFHYSPREAEIMDPQHRVFLECAWEALETAGVDSNRYSGLIGVFAGASYNTYLLNNILSNPKMIETVGEFQTIISNQNDHLATRVAYQMNLRGPCLTIQTACSTSLVATHLACQSLIAGECDMAMAGGVSILFPQKRGYLYQEGGILSKNGRCAAFDEKADGTVGGSGVGIVVLKRLEDAIRDRDTILSVILGSAVNNDGSGKVGYTAPSVDGQASVIRSAQAAANVNPEWITYIEAHGTGTRMGDPIEIAALAKAFRTQTEKKGYCAVGSVKTNIGHLDAAAGVTGLIKTVLALMHKKIPPSLHYQQSNPEIDFANSPFYVNSKLVDWRLNGHLRCAGVSSFGMGGANAHVIVSESMIPFETSESRQWQLLTLSTASDFTLKAAKNNFISFLKNNKDINLADVSNTLQTGRSIHSNRQFCVVRNRDDALQKIENPCLNSVFARKCDSVDRPVTLLFAGQGSQYVGMGYDLYKYEPEFRKWFDLCAERVNVYLSGDIRYILFPRESQKDEAERLLQKTAITQPALFILEYAMSQMWISWGIKINAMIGHSLGEYTAACLAGVFSLEDAMVLVSARGRLMQEMPPGQMMAVPMSERELMPLIDDRLSIAAINAPSMCIVSGETRDIELLEKIMMEKSIQCSRLHTTHAFHSYLMDDSVTKYLNIAKTIRLQSPKIPFISNNSGTWIKESEALDPVYWANLIRRTVRFSDGIAELLKDKNRILLEIGPGRTLASLVKKRSDIEENHTVISSLGHPMEKKPEIECVITALGHLWNAGAKIDWSGFYKKERRSKVPLPTYPFDRKIYWIEPGKNTIARDERDGEKISNVRDWLYAPIWKQANMSIDPKFDFQQNDNNRWLIFTGNQNVSKNIAEQLIDHGQSVIYIEISDRYSSKNNDIYRINPESEEDYVRLFDELRKINYFPNRILHAWTIGDDMENQDKIYHNGYECILFITKNLLRINQNNMIIIDVLSTGIHDVFRTDRTDPNKALILGPCLVIPQECSNIRIRCLDIQPIYLKDTSQTNKESAIVKFLRSSSPASNCVLRGDRFWIQDYDRLHHQASNTTHTVLREEGVYLITGGLGNIGLTLAKTIAKTKKVKLVLLTHSLFPVRSEWESWIRSKKETDRTRQKIQKLLSVEEFGSEIMMMQADVSSRSEMKEAIEKVLTKYGKINGVIHSAGISDQEITNDIQEFRQGTNKKLFSVKKDSLPILEDVLQGIDLDFCIINSSLSSILGGLGFSAYAAVNIYIDRFTALHNQNSSIPWYSINWDGWNFERKNEIVKLSMTPEEGSDVFSIILSFVGIYQIAVSTGDLYTRLKRWVNRNEENSNTQQNNVNDQRTKTKNATEILAPPNDDVQRVIADVWCDLLGIEKIGIHDNFFDLGGHSLMVTQLLSRIRSLFKIDLPLKKLFEKPTIEEISKMIVEMESHPGIAEKTAKLRLMLNSMSQETIRQMINEKKGC